MALVLVTGASAGLGRTTASALQEAGHDVVLHARSRDRLEGSGAVRGARGIVLGDLADAGQTLEVAEQAAAHGPFDAVIHNAGTLDGPDDLAVNVLAPYLLTAAMPLPARVIVLSSSMHRSGRAEAQLIRGERRATYSDTKLLVTAFALGLASRFPGILAHAVDPGWVPTRMGGPSAPDDLDEGHRTQVRLATAPTEEIVPRTGGYWHHLRTERPHPAATDPAFQAEVLAQLADRTGRELPGPGTA